MQAANPGPKIAKTTSVPARINIRIATGSDRAMVACKLIFKSAHGSTATARLKVSTRPCSGVLARMTEGCWEKCFDEWLLKCQKDLAFSKLKRDRKFSTAERKAEINRRAAH